MAKYFGTDGVRGVANRELTPELAFWLARAGAYVLTKDSTHTPKILLGKDGRRSGDMLEAALTAGLCSIGVDVYHGGVIPTPAVAYLVQKYQMDAGIMISASHNPMEDNGIKFFTRDGCKLDDDTEAEIESLINHGGNDNLPRPEGAGVGTANPCPNAAADYAAFLISTVPNLRLDGLNVALDCANGATSAIAPIVFEKLGAKVHTLSNKPDGANINAGCGSTHINHLAQYVAAQKVDIGLAFDGDGDRMLAVDENGNALDGDSVLAICGLNLHERGQLAKSTLVATSMSNQGLELFCNKNNITLFRTDVGDRYVLEKMLADDLTLGGEQSGHYIFRQFCTTGDGILAGLQLMATMARKNQPLSVLSSAMETFPQVLVNVIVPNHRKKELKTHDKIKAHQAQIENQLAGEGRILVRPSGTEPLVRVMIEGRDVDEINRLAADLAKTIEGCMKETNSNAE